ncbi:PilW family protein [Pseudomonas sp. CC6-YY-74]|uniref:PilW family protein n=1 Tax=Pseudomonas sp. CC6-YY-74 TaxID=1930532 RepID=UPI0009A246F1|nr:PilW family protein [Pseudomonas sp. CC6-YY-74]
MNKQHGISIIELLVALLISSFLILGITQVYLDNKQSYLFQQGQSNNIENGRFAILLLEQEFAKTGYRRRPDEEPANAFPSAPIPGCGTFNPGQVVRRVSDTKFCLRYQPAFANARTCEGNTITGIPPEPYTDADVITSVYELTVSDTDNTSLNLTCRSYSATTATGVGAQQIASNITAMSFEYGFNTNEEKIVSRYAKDPSDNEVRAVRFSTLVSSSTEITKEPSSAVYTYWFGTEPGDKKLYNMLSSSISMRNRMP